MASGEEGGGEEEEEEEEEESDSDEDKKLPSKREVIKARVLIRFCFQPILLTLL